MKNIILKLSSLVLTCTIILSSLVISPTFAKADPSADGSGKDGGTSSVSSNVCDSSAAEEVKRAAGCYGNANAVVTIVQVILNTIIAAIGIVAVIFIVIGGVNFMTSAGDPGKVKKAKDTILYAIIGLIVCALAFTIVNWTISVLNNSGKSSDKDEDDKKSSLILDTSLPA